MTLSARALLPLLPVDSTVYHDRGLRNLLWHLHGSLVCLAFLFFFPLGIIAIRSGSRYAFQTHYLLQLSASLFALSGITVGIVTSKGLGLWHQYLGLILGFVILLQPIAGWRHHVVFLKEKRRSRISGVHVWAGRIGMGAAWVNVLEGLVLREYHFLVQAATGVLILCFVVLWMLWGLGIFQARGGASGFKALDQREDSEGLMTGVGNDFALDDLDDEEDEEEEERSKAHP